ncbi:hypothetical protein [Shewanella algae]|uniref:hypothetical protein n=1 Tax=Shewanella algae TaxID=38313 RepID=UPI00313ECEF4
MKMVGAGSFVIVVILAVTGCDKNSYRDSYVNHSSNNLSEVLMLVASPSVSYINDLSIISSASIDVDIIFKDGCIKRLKESTTFDWLFTIVKPIGVSNELLFSEYLLDKGEIPISINASALSGTPFEAEIYKTVLVWRNSQKWSFLGPGLKIDRRIKRSFKRLAKALKSTG